MNHWSGIGRLTADLELKTSKHDNSKRYTYGTLAVIRPYNSDFTDFFHFTAFNETAAGMSKWLAKGNRIGVEGYFKQVMKDTRNGEKYQTYELIIERWEFADDKRKNSAAKDEPPPDDGLDEITDDRIPF